MVTGINYKSYEKECFKQTMPKTKIWWRVVDLHHYMRTDYPHSFEVEYSSWRSLWNIQYKPRTCQSDDSSIWRGKK